MSSKASKSPTTKKIAETVKAPKISGKTFIDTSSGTITIDGVTMMVRGHATLPTFKIEESKPTLVQFDGEMVTKPKTNKSGPMLDQEGNPAFVTVARVVLPLTGEVGQIVCGAVLVRALKDYVGGYVGKQFVLTKHPGEAGKAKQWTVVEVSL